jgi:DNA-binding IclR family transcriptional regulator
MPLRGDERLSSQDERNQMTISSEPTTADEQADRDNPLFVQSVDRALRVLSAFRGAEHPLSLGELADRAGIGRSAVQRLVFTLRELGYIDRDPADSGYVPGIRILDHSHDYQRLNPVIVRATPVLLELRRAVRERVDLSLRDDLRLVYAQRLQSKREILTSTLVGHAVPIHATSGGWAILASLEEAEVDDILARSDLRAITLRTLTNPDAIRTKVAEARREGFALAQEQVLLGEIVIGVAIRGLDGTPVGAIHVAGSLSEWQPEDYARHVAPLAMAAAATISRSWPERPAR